MTVPASIPAMHRLPVVLVCRRPQHLCRRANHLHISARPVAAWGAFRDRHGSLAAGCDGRVSTQRGSVCADERRCTNGQVARSWHPDADVPRNALEAHCAHGGQQARCTRENAKQPLKPIAQGGPGVFGQTCGTCRLHSFRRRATGAASARPSLRPLLLRVMSLNE